ncbi:MAG: NTP transferase domain-containing protein [Spirochaetes bacterium]|nr:NTP transferase domain-containing protein [Spirochaetota bacterium]
MRAIVLAAGTGSRLGEITKARTKGMVPVNGKRLIDYLLDFFETEFFDEIIIVGGYHYTDLKDHVDNKKIKNIRVIENREYLKGNIFTLKRALNEFNNDSFLITNVDHIYPRKMFVKIKKSFKEVTAMCDFDRNLTHDDMKVKLRKPGSTIELIRKDLNEFDCGYIGMTYVDKSADGIYRDAVERAVEKFGEKAVAENVLQILANDAATAPGICDLSGIGWYEVDTEEDLKKAEAGLLKDINFNVAAK